MAPRSSRTLALKIWGVVFRFCDLCVVTASAIKWWFFSALSSLCQAVAKVLTLQEGVQKRTWELELLGVTMPEFSACWMLRGIGNDQRKYLFQDFLHLANKAAWALAARWCGSHRSCISCLGGVEVQAGSYQPVFPVLNNAMSFLVN